MLNTPNALVENANHFSRTRFFQKSTNRKQLLRMRNRARAILATNCKLTLYQHGTIEARLVIAPAQSSNKDIVLAL